MRVFHAVLLVIGLCLAPLTLAAQSSQADRDFLTAFLEENLSDAGRNVTILGFRGALSSVATMDLMTIADEEGVWITLRDVALSWDRSALLSGQIMVDSLTAAEVVMDRNPNANDSSALTAAEGAAFLLPELPVSVMIGKVAIDRIVLGRDVLGEEIAGRADASVFLTGGEGKATLNLDRSDEGPKGELALEVGFSNATNVLTLSIHAKEDADGIAVRLLSVPGAPSAELTINGVGPLDDFKAEVALMTDGQPRLSGQVDLAGRGEGRRDFAARLGGDLAPVFWPAYREFLGDALTLKATGTSFPDGRLEVSEITVTSGALWAKGRLAIAADGLPEQFDLGLAISSPDSTPLFLPLTTEVPTRITSANLQLKFDARDSELWQVDGMIAGLDRADVRAANLILSGGGLIARSPEGAAVSADLDFVVLELEPTDPALAKALGKSASGKLAAQWQAGSGVTHVSDLSFVGEDFQFNAIADVHGLSTGFAVDGAITGDWTDLSRLSDLSGLALGGSAKLALVGTASLLGNAFDLTLTAQGENMSVGQPQIDTLLSGQAKVDGRISRNESGTTLRDLTLSAGSASATISGLYTQAAIDLQGRLSLPDLGAFGRDYRGRLEGRAGFVGTSEQGAFTFSGSGDGLGVGQAEIDRLLSGPTTLDLTISLKDRIAYLQSANLDGRSVDLMANGQSDGGTLLELRLADLGLIVPKFSGPVTLAGPIYQTANGPSFALDAKGPAGIAGTLRGTLDETYSRADMTFVGQSQADVINPFVTPRALSGALTYDLRLSGPLGLNSLSGRIGLSGGRLADPALNFGLQGIEAAAQIRNGQAEVAVNAGVTTGGSLEISGQSGVAFPFPGVLTIDVQEVLLRDPRLYDTTASGRLTMEGNLAGGAVVKGQISLGRTELRIPSSGLGGSEPIPDILHLSEPAAVRQTRANAGLIGPTVAAPSANLGTFGLDIKVSAPRQIFLRGRGLDAELGGNLRLRGTSSDLRPEGSFELIRGRLDIVGRRLVLSEAQLLLEGAFVPRINILATTEGDDIISTLRIFGPASDPQIQLESSPALPEEEVLAHLLFGERLESLSAFQALQLAAAIRTLAGKGGEGLVGKLRKRTGLDNLDIKTDETGTTNLTAGKYLSEKVYSEVSVDQTGKSQIDLNLEIRPHISLKAKASSDGDSSLGLFLEKNY